MPSVNVMTEAGKQGVQKERVAFSAQLFAVVLVVTLVTLTFYGIQQSASMGFLQFFLPVPIVFLSLRNVSLWSGVAAALCSAAAISVWFGPRTGILFLFGVGVVAVIVSLCFLRKYTATSSIAWLTAYYVILGILAVYIQEGLSFEEHTQRLMGLFMQHQQEFIDLYKQQGLPQYQIEALFESLARVMSVTFPFISASVSAIVTYFVIRLLLKFQRVILPPLRSFQDWGVSDHMVWLFILGGLLFHFEETSIVGINLLLGLTLLYYLQGCAVITFIMRKKRAAKFLQFVVYLLLFLQIPYGMIGMGLLLTGAAAEGLLLSLPALIMVAGIGLANVWVDFRKRLKQARL
ncbi:hypothetical protein CSB45_14845 [candidate division KSB3 bacterium]|uniref:DUF2232 domain-containing protein n=1 Tax=candidate division KSB3 bacterium TaxID=2044937 RepID=A0A2G6E0T0_9BACT|nr:MAG: hypothetical protein CSB45_14845 [candidate division KSB3 bacterium]PIE28345.1 MAG: hypothetical protein CSA57_14325 [candidate division KSB3 bacterium]